MFTFLTHKNGPNAVKVNPRSGFTLIETLVAITVLLLAVAAPITYAAKGIQNTYYARDQIVAFYLAQEGIELVRASRDDNALSELGWLNGTLSNCTTTNGCGIDVRTTRNDFVACGASDDTCRMYYDPRGLTGSRGIYVMPGVSGTTATTYVRRIRLLNDASNDNERLIESEVKWTTGAVTKTIKVRSKIFDQYDKLFQ